MQGNVVVSGRNLLRNAFFLVLEKDNASFSHKTVFFKNAISTEERRGEKALFSFFFPSFFTVFTFRAPALVRGVFSFLREAPLELYVWRPGQVRGHET